MADAATIMGETGVIYVCAECGTPVESEPCKDHQPAAHLAGALSWAPAGARCKVPGFEDWRANDFNGWIQDETGYMVDHLVMAEQLLASGALPESSGSQEASSGQA